MTPATVRDRIVEAARVTPSRDPEGRLERALIDEIVTCISNQADAVREEAADEFRNDNDGIAGERDPQP